MIKLYHGSNVDIDSIDLSKGHQSAVYLYDLLLEELKQTNQPPTL